MVIDKSAADTGAFFTEANIQQAAIGVKDHDLTALRLDIDNRAYRGQEKMHPHHATAGIGHMLVAEGDQIGAGDRW